MNTTYMIKTRTAYETAALMQVLAKTDVHPCDVEGDGLQTMWFYVYASDLSILHATAQEMLRKTAPLQGLMAVTAELGAKAYHHAGV